MKRVISCSRIFALAIAALLLSACSGEFEWPRNISAESVSVVTPDPAIANPVTVSFELRSDQLINDVPVALFAIDKTNDPNVEAREFPLGTMLIEQLNAGTESYEMEVVIPASLEFAGPYYFSVVVDPAETIKEFPKNDNAVSTEVMLAESGGINLILTDVAIDRTALTINTDEYVLPTADNTYNADAGGTITVGADGLELGETVDIEAFASLRINRLDTGAELEMPLYLWNTAEGRYNRAYGIEPESGVIVNEEWLPMGQFEPLLAELSGDEVALDDVQRNSEHMDFYFPGRLGSELENALRYPGQAGTQDATQPPPDLTAAAIGQLKVFLAGLPFSGILGDESAGLAALEFHVCVTIRPTDPAVTDISPGDNEVCQPLEIFLPPLPQGTVLYDIGGYNPHYSMPSLPMSTGTGFATNNSNDYFAFNIDFGVSLTADERGFIGAVNASIPIEIFGNPVTFMGIGVQSQLVPDYINKPAEDESGFTFEIVFLNQTLDLVPPIRPLVSFDILSHDLLTPEVISYSKEVEKETMFMVGPVPMVLGGSVGGNFGLDYSIGYADDAPPILGGGNPVVSFGGSIGPVASLEAAVSLGVGIKGITAGVEGVLILLEEAIVFFFGTEIEVIDDGYASNNVEFVILPQLKVSNIFTGPQGELNLFVKYATFKWTTCKVGVVKYKCIKIGERKHTLNLYTTPALFQREDVLIEDSFPNLDVVKIPGKPTAYFSDQ